MARWQTAKIGDVCTVERGGSPRPIDKYITDSDDGINWIKIGDTSDSMYITKTAQKIIPEGMKKSRYVKPGDFLLSNSMSFGRPYILKIDGCIHDGWLVLRDNQNQFDKRFLYYFLSAPITCQKFQSLAVGGVVNNLNSEMVRGLEVPIPSMKDQKKIADTLGRIDWLITLRKQQLAKLDELVKARFVEMFGNSKTNPRHWAEKELRTVANVGSSKRVFVNELQNSGVPFYRGTEIGALAAGDDVVPELFINPEHYRKLCDASGAPQRGDLLMPSICSDGRIWLVDTDAPFYFKDGRVLWVHPTDENIESTYLLYALKEKVITDYSNIASGTTFAELKIFSLKDIRIMVPPLELQQKFALFVQSADVQRLTTRQGLDKLEMLKRTLMQEYFG